MDHRLIQPASRDQIVAIIRQRAERANLQRDLPAHLGQVSRRPTMQWADSPYAMCYTLIFRHSSLRPPSLISPVGTVAVKLAAASESGNAIEIETVTETEETRGAGSAGATCRCTDRPRCRRTRRPSRGSSGSPWWTTCSCTAGTGGCPASTSPVSRYQTTNITSR